MREAEGGKGAWSPNLGGSVEQRGAELTGLHSEAPGGLGSFILTPGWAL